MSGSQHDIMRSSGVTAEEFVRLAKSCRGMFVIVNADCSGLGDMPLDPARLRHCWSGRVIKLPYKLLSRFVLKSDV